MKKRYLVFVTGLFLISCYFIFGSAYFTNYDLTHETELSDLQDQRKLVIDEIDSTLCELKESYNQTQQQIIELSSEEYIEEHTLIKYNTLTRDSVVTVKKYVEQVVPVYIHDTIIVVVTDTVYKTIEIEVPQETKKKRGKRKNK